MNDQIQKKPDKTFSLTKTGLKSKQSGFQERLNAQIGTQLELPLTLPNRIVVAGDCSGSMYGQSIIHLKEAIHNFIGRCNPVDTSVALRTFPLISEVDTMLTNVHLMLHKNTDKMNAGGGTPMFDCLDSAIGSFPMTRLVLISDGEPTDGYVPLDINNKELLDPRLAKILGQYVEAGVPIDTVHIGESSRGEHTLQYIAKYTGGIYIKFTDTASLMKGLSYLTPSYRALLQSGQIDAKALGATEFKK